MSGTILCAWCSLVPLRAQTLAPSTINYGLKDGLPSQELYSIQQDSTGHLWIATDRGLVRFDGQNFTTFTRSDGLSDDSVLQLKKDKKGRIWVYGHDGGLSYWDGQRINTYRGNQQLVEDQSTKFIISTHITASDSIYIGSCRGMQVGSLSSENLRTVPSRDFCKAPNCIRMMDGQPVFFGGQCNVGDRIDFCGQMIHTPTPELVIRARPIRTRSGIVLLNWGAHLYWKSEADSTILHRVFSHKILGITEDKAGNIWLNFQDGGAKRLNGGDPNASVAEHLFKDESVTHIFQDFSLGMWFATLGSGLHFLPNRHCQSFVNPNPIKGIQFFEYALDTTGAVWLSNGRGGIFRADPFQRQTVRGKQS